jgi:hypothetical protein
VSFEQPIAMLRASERSITLDDDHQPAAGQRGIYLVRHVDEWGRREADVTHMTANRRSALPAWPSAPGWTPARQNDAWRIEARWASAFSVADVQSVELIEQSQGELEQAVETRNVNDRESAVAFTRSATESPVRYRLRMTSSSGAASLSPWSAWVTPPSAAPQTINRLEVEQ